MSPKFIVDMQQGGGVCSLDRQFYDQLYIVNIELPMSCPVRQAGVRTSILFALDFLTANFLIIIVAYHITYLSRGQFLLFSFVSLECNIATIKTCQAGSCIGCHYETTQMWGVG